MEDLPGAPFGNYLGDKVAHISGDIGNGGVMGDVDRRVAVDLAYQVVQQRLDLKSIQV